MLCYYLFFTISISFISFGAKCYTEGSLNTQYIIYFFIFGAIIYLFIISLLQVFNYDEVTQTTT